MKFFKKQPIISILAILLIVLVSFYFYNPSKGIAHNIPQKEHLVTKKDREPLIIPEASIKAGKTVTLPILMYHHVGEYPQDANSIRKDLSVPTSNFESETAWLAAKGYNSITLEQLYLFSQGKFTLPKKPIIFTFDDGYKDDFDNAVPILKKYNFVGSFAVITQWPGQTQGTNIYASWDDIQKAKSEDMEIVCHTQNHFDGTNPKFDSSYIFQNLSGCKKDLNDHGISTDILIYPYGHYSLDYINQAKKVGFVMGVTVHHGDVINLDNLMQVPRIRVHGAETLGKFENAILHKIAFSKK
jgi:peptidoglycan/xylan/chitin deacetylase (PgdA/CDA1 family)